MSLNEAAKNGPVMVELLTAILPEILLLLTGSALLLMGASDQLKTRLATPYVAFLAIAAVIAMQITRVFSPEAVFIDRWGAVQITEFTQYVRLIVAAIALGLVLLCWPTDRSASGNPSANFASETGEFFAMLLFAVAGVFLVAGANDIILLFLAIELASIPMYIMISISRPLPVAQEATVKYFFLGAMSAAILLFGLSYLYGTSGSLRLDEIQQSISAGGVSSWEMLGLVMVILGLCFKIAAVPLHFYVGDVYQGAATPMTAILSFIPKTSGMVALIKILFVSGGGGWVAPPEIAQLIAVLAVLTMTVGNVLGLIQTNVKRVFAYSSVAHTGYMLVGVAALVSVHTAPGMQAEVQDHALRGVLFYIAAYGVMNVAAFGVLTLLPSKSNKAATSAETYDDIAGMGRQHVYMGLAMAASCFSLTGMPLTIGFFGKFFLLQPALQAGLTWLAVATVINAAISAGYYLRIVMVMFMRPEVKLEYFDPDVEEEREFQEVEMHPEPSLRGPLPVMLAVVLSTVGTILMGAVFPLTQRLTDRVAQAQFTAPVVNTSESVEPVTRLP